MTASKPVVDMPMRRETRETFTSARLDRRMLLRGAAATGLTGIGFDGLRADRAAAHTAMRPAANRPNVIVISFDDLGWNGLGCYGNDFHETPNIDRLAGDGMRFTQAYAAAPVCSPTRAAMMTGLFPARTGITNYLDEESVPGMRFLAPRFRSVPKYVADRGYRSALIGKWHLTEDYSGPYRKRLGNPYVHGFDDVLLSEEKYIDQGDMFYPYRFMPSVRGRTPRYLTDRIARDSAEWITRHADQPFFMHISNYAIHNRWEAPQDLIDKYRRKQRLNPEFDNNRYVPAVAAMVERCDDQVGRIDQALRDAGIADNTLLLITSDNGGHVPASNRPLRGEKGTLYEGGIRVPLIASWPGAVPAGTTSDAVVSTVDILPTIKELAGAGDRGSLDGLSLAGVLLHQQDLDRDAYWYYPHRFAGIEVPSAAIRSGDYKLIKRLKTGKLELYNLAADRRERRNLADKEPAIAAELHRKLRRHIRAMKRA
jgi:arylsulfatase A-like enzyme